MLIHISSVPSSLRFGRTSLHGVFQSAVNFIAADIEPTRRAMHSSPCILPRVFDVTDSLGLGSPVIPVHFHSGALVASGTLCVHHAKNLDLVFVHFGVSNDYGSNSQEACKYEGSVNRKSHTAKENSVHEYLPVFVEILRLFWEEKFDRKEDEKQ